jgi:hypothetical protein
MFIMMEQHIMFGDDLFDMNHPFNQNMEKFCNRYYKDWQKLNQKIQNNRPNEPRVTYVKQSLSQLKEIYPNYPEEIENN